MAPTAPTNVSSMASAAIAARHAPAFEAVDERIERVEQHAAHHERDEHVLRILEEPDHRHRGTQAERDVPDVHRHLDCEWRWRNAGVATRGRVGFNVGARWPAVTYGTGLPSAG